MNNEGSLFLCLFLCRLQKVQRQFIPIQSFICSNIRTFSLATLSLSSIINGIFAGVIAFPSLLTLFSVLSSTSLLPVVRDGVGARGDLLLLLLLLAPLLLIQIDLQVLKFRLLCFFNVCNSLCSFLALSHNMLHLFWQFLHFSFMRLQCLCFFLYSFVRGFNSNLA